MPRHADPELVERVLDAAQKLWRRGGDKAFSMRVLARLAKTNTPAIYRRFKNREDILRALLERLRLDVYESLKTAKTLEDACEVWIDFALRHPREYELYYAHQFKLLRGGRAHGWEEIGPNFQWTINKIAEELGGSPQEHVRLALVMWALSHGTATLLISKAVPASLEPEIRAACVKAVGDLVRSARS